MEMRIQEIAMNEITYCDDIRTQVQIGDRVTFRPLFFWKITGDVVYVPGSSPKRRDMEYWEKQHICIRTRKGSCCRACVHDGQVSKKVRFLKRQEHIAGLTAEEIISGDDEIFREYDAMYPPKPGIMLMKTKERSLNKFNGYPNLPESIEWPKNPDGTELDLLAQFRCGDFPAGLGLPDHGMLYFFYEIGFLPSGNEEEDRKHWKIIYTGEPPSPEPRKAKGKEDYPEVFVKFLAFESALSDVSRFEEDCDRHLLLGHPLWIQTTPETMDPERILLLQLDSDTCVDGPEWMWGDVGHIYFHIKPEELAERRFDKAVMSMEFY